MQPSDDAAHPLGYRRETANLMFVSEVGNASGWERFFFFLFFFIFSFFIFAQNILRALSHRTAVAYLLCEDVSSNFPDVLSFKRLC